MKIHVQCLVQNPTPTGCLINVSVPLPVSGSYRVPTETLSCGGVVSAPLLPFLLFVLIACTCFEGSISNRSSLDCFESLFSLIVLPPPLIRITPASSAFRF